MDTKWTQQIKKTLKAIANKTTAFTVEITWEHILPHSDYTCPWWRHQKETVFALLALCAGNSPVTGEFPAQRSVTRSFDAFFALHLNRQLSRQWRRWWFETLPRSPWRHCNAFPLCFVCCVFFTGKFNDCSSLHHCYRNIRSTIKYTLRAYLYRIREWYDMIMATRHGNSSCIIGSLWGDHRIPLTKGQ